MDYIHLNPVRAGLCDVKSLKDYQLSSFPKFFKQSPQDGLRRGDFLGILDLTDTLAGMRRYATHLELCEEQDPERQVALTKRYCRGWFIGDKERKKALAEDLNKKHKNVDWEGADLKEIKIAQWEALTAVALKKRKKQQSDIEADAKGAEWKNEIALLLRAQTTASNPWIAGRPNMGHPSRISNLRRERK